MTESDRQRLLATLAGVYGFYGADLTEFAVGVWCKASEQIGKPAAFVAALERHLLDPKAGSWLPKPADIIRALSGSEDEAALLAWGEVLEVVRRGGDGLDRLPDAARAALRDMGGSSVIGRSDESQNGFLQRRFVDAFLAYRRRDGAMALSQSHQQALQ